MLALIQKHHLYDPKSSFATVMRVDMVKVRNLTLAASLAAMALIGWAVAAGLLPSELTGGGNAIMLPRKVSEAAGLSVTVTPPPLSPGREVSFKVTLDTHTGDLGFDRVKVSHMQYSGGNIYQPKAWNGSPPGGHHREGTLSFPSLTGSPTSIKLVLKDLYGVDRVFEWSLLRG